MLAATDRHFIKRTLDSLRGNYRPFYLILATDEAECTAEGCGYDQFTQSGKNPTCQACNGTGMIITWSPLEVRGRLQYYDVVKLSAAGMPPGIEIGDVVSYVSADVMNAVSELRSSAFSYAYIDGDTYRPYSIAPTGVGYADEWRIEWKRTEMDVRAAGY